MYSEKEPARIRRATLDDIDAIADVVLASLASDPSWKIMIPYGFHKDATYRQYARDILMRHLAPESFDSLVLVAECPSKGSYTIVSVAVWNTTHSRYHDAWRKCKLWQNPSPVRHDEQALT
jgi:hypothetical protein